MGWLQEALIITGRSWSVLATVLLLAGCGSGQLLVKKEEVVPIRTVKVDFVEVFPNGDGSRSYTDISNALNQSGYYSKLLGYRVEQAVAEGLKQSGVEAHSASVILPVVGKDTFSHVLTIVPNSFSAQYRYGAYQWTQISASYELIDLASKQKVWRSSVLIPVANADYSPSFAKEILFAWNKFGFVKLGQKELDKLKYGTPGK